MAASTAQSRAAARELAHLRKLDAALVRYERVVAAQPGVAVHVERADALRARIAVLAAGRCRQCRRVLTDPESVARGLGSDCAAKLAS